MTVGQHHGDRLEVVAVAQLVDAAERVLARVDHERLGARRGRDDVAVRLERACGKPTTSMRKPSRNGLWDEASLPERFTAMPPDYWLRNPGPGRRRSPATPATC